MIFYFSEDKNSSEPVDGLTGGALTGLLENKQRDKLIADRVELGGVRRQNLCNFTSMG